MSERLMQNKRRLLTKLNMNEKMLMNDDEMTPF